MSKSLKTLLKMILDWVFFPWKPSSKKFQYLSMERAKRERRKITKTQKCVYLKTFEFKRKEYKPKTLKSPQVNPTKGKPKVDLHFWSNIMSSINHAQSLFQGSSGNKSISRYFSIKRNRPNFSEIIHMVIRFTKNFQNLCERAPHGNNQLTRKWYQTVVTGLWFKPLTIVLSLRMKWSWPYSKLL